MKKILTVALAVVMLGVGASAALAAGQGCGGALPWQVQGLPGAASPGARTITIEEVQGMTMREIQELVQQLTGEEPATQTEHAGETSSGHGHGQGGGRHGQ